MGSPCYSCKNSHLYNKVTLVEGEASEGREKKRPIVSKLGS